MNAGETMAAQQVRLFSVRWIALLLVGCVPQVALAQGVTYVKEHYTKHEQLIPMRDGVKLYTIWYVPKDMSKPYPILLQRTPYSAGPYGPDQFKGTVGPSQLFGREGYIVAYQDVRGKFMSEGDFAEMRPELVDYKGPKDIDESTDTWDTVDWLVKNVPNNNGKVGQWGISYVGFYAGVGMVNAHPALKASSPQAPQTDWFMGDDVHHNGAFFLQQEFTFDATFGLPRPKPTTRQAQRTFNYDTNDGYQFFLKMGPLPRANELYFKNQIGWWNDIMAHPNYDAFWQARNLLPHLKNIRPAVLTVGGWFDAEDLYGALNMYQQIEKHSPKTVNHLVMGPWSHGGWAGGAGSSLGSVRFGSNTANFYREKMEFPFFQHYLKGEGEMKMPKAWVFETGKNQWHEYPAWPPAEAKSKSIYLAAGKKLSFSAPTEAAATAYDEYVSDPVNPVPYSATKSIQYPRTFMVEDQRFVAKRPDVLVYETDVLATDVTVAGPIEAAFHVSTSGTDSDLVVKLIDVTPEGGDNVRMGGYQQLVRGDVMRGKFRKSFEKPEPFVPNEPDSVGFVMPDIYHTFLKGHRIMVQVQSTWFPLVDRNPQTFTDIYQAKESDFQKATQRVYRTSAMPSQLKFKVLE
jgi:putative CocE/NonD family hydrolase